jgi:hypothetical protein
MTTTTKLGMTIVEPTDHAVGTSVSDGLMQKINDAWTRLDAGIGAFNCTSVTRPSVPYAGQVIYETDTRYMYVRNSANTAWVIVNSGIPAVSGTGSVPSPFTNQIVYDTTVPGLMIYNGSTWAVYNPHSQFKWKTSTQNFSGTTMAPDLHLSFTYVASARYKLDCFLEYTANGATDGGLQISFNFSSAVNYFRYANYAPNSGSAAALTQYNVVTEPENLTVGRAIGTNTTVRMSLAPKGTLLTTAGQSGTMQLYAAQVSSTASATQLLLNSWAELRRVA